MTLTKRMLGTLAIACMMVSLPACDVAAKKTSNDLKQVLLSYHSYLDDKKAPPPDEKEFSAWVSAKQPEVAAPLARLQAAGYKVYWGTPVANLPAGSSNTILIHPADAATKGGLVGYADGSARQVTAEAFNKAAKPTTK